MPKWTAPEISDLIKAVNSPDIVWKHPDKYHRQNVKTWKHIGYKMSSSREYHCIRNRYKNYHDAEFLRNKDRSLTQQEERALRKFTQRSPNGLIRFKPGFDAVATQLKIPIFTAKKRY